METTLLAQNNALNIKSILCPNHTTHTNILLDYAPGIYVIGKYGIHLSNDVHAIGMQTKYFSILNHLHVHNYCSMFQLAQTRTCCIYLYKKKHVNCPPISRANPPPKMADLQ